jgi:hypothetical protein
LFTCNYVQKLFTGWQENFASKFNFSVGKTF